MENKLLITQALDERDLLVKKITSKIDAFQPIDIRRNNEEKVLESRVTEEEFQQKARSAYQQIQDLIHRYQKIDEAIIVSNATTMIQTSYGEISVAAAISLRNRLKEQTRYSTQLTNFEEKLENKLEKEYQRFIRAAEEKNRMLNNTAENMRLSILGKENKVKEEKPLEIVNEYVKENTMELVDPIGVLDKIEESRNKRNTLLTELETQIKVSNATTFIAV